MDRSEEVRRWLELALEEEPRIAPAREAVQAFAWYEREAFAALPAPVRRVLAGLAVDLELFEPNPAWRMQGDLYGSPHARKPIRATLLAREAADGTAGAA